MSHPNLSDEINKNISESELAGGVWFKDLPRGSVVKVQTRNTLYTIERREDGDYISGNGRYCREPVKANITGSTWGGSMIKVGWIGIDMLLEFSTSEHVRVTTSTIREVWVEK
jgi:hypothetical protein